MSKMEKVYNKFNLLREKHGLPTLSRREFVRALAIASAGSYVPFLSCSGSGNNDDYSTAGEAGGFPMGGVPTTAGADPISSAGQSGVVTVGTGGAVPASSGGVGGAPVGTGGAGSAGSGPAGRPRPAYYTFTRPAQRQVLTGSL